jgi:hypothetical protein
MSAEYFDEQRRQLIAAIRAHTDSLTRYDARSELGGKQMSRREFIALLGGVASRTMR